jgi:hypothetical protein
MIPYFSEKVKRDTGLFENKTRKTHGICFFKERFSENRTDGLDKTLLEW